MPRVDGKAQFKKLFARWVVETSQPLTVCQTVSVKKMIHCLNPNISFPDRKELLAAIDIKKEQTVKVLKQLIGSIFFCHH